MMSHVLVGTRVRTAEKIDGRDYTEEGRAKRRPGLSGSIVSFSDSHGLCFCVRHDDDGSMAFYDPDEIFDERTGLPVTQVIAVREVMDD